ncbi:hypothetical protein ILUMI_10109 [Ignelater luminosus]|uniref:Uncharacterized protein n=1 Tax=Ignelater luminosus TaxID=2038154 RepID=A0A8K0D7S6_IGNLU|nr:hypothetical protein ILUMI_10109 [Ignelater luminosus]
MSLQSVKNAFRIRFMIHTLLTPECRLSSSGEVIPDHFTNREVLAEAEIVTKSNSIDQAPVEDNANLPKCSGNEPKQPDIPNQVCEIPKYLKLWNGYANLMKKRKREEERDKNTTKISNYFTALPFTSKESSECFETETSQSIDEGVKSDTKNDSCRFDINTDDLHEEIIEIRRRLQGVYGLNVLRRKEVSVWCKEFEDGRGELKDDPEKKRDRPRTSHTNYERQIGKAAASFVPMIDNLPQEELPYTFT